MKLDSALEYTIIESRKYTKSLVILLVNRFLWMTFKITKLNSSEREYDFDNYFVKNE